MVTVYGTKACAGCRMTVRQLERGGVRPAVRDVKTDHSAAREAEEIAQALGRRELPLVVADGRVWSGYRSDMVEAVVRDRREHAEASPAAGVSEGRAMSA